MSQKLTILFDLDGTLVNTAPDLMNAHNYVMKKYGYEERKLSDIKKLAGRGSKVMLARSIQEMAELSGKIEKTDDKIEEMITQNKGSEKKITAFYKQSKNKQQLFNEMLNEKLFEKLSEYAKVKVVEKSTIELRKKQAA